MTARSIRRAAERKAKKAALKAERHAAPELFIPSLSSESEPLSEDLGPAPGEPGHDESEHALFSPAPLSAAQLAANRSNAQFSTGPSSPEGKAKSSINAVKTALTGRTVLLPTDEAPEYERHLRAWQEDLRPAGARECDLVQSIADTTWRLKRIPCLESAIFAQGHIEFAESFNQHDPSLRGGMIEVQTFMKYEKQIRNLQLQEARLVRRREKERAELRELQQQRREREQEALQTAAQLYLEAKASNRTFEPTANGFVFSTGEIERHLARTRSQNRVQNSPDKMPKFAKQAA